MAPLAKTSGRRALRVESLEARLALDGQGLTVVDDAFSVRQNGPQVEFDVLANDIFTNEYQGAGLITSVSFGSEGGRIEIAPDGGSVLYTPPADFGGFETFDYAIDGAHTGTVSVTVAAALRDDSFSVTPTGETRSLDVLANDPFWDGYDGPRRITSVSVGSAGGVVEIAADGRSINYEAPLPDRDSRVRERTETFIYVVDDLYPARVTIEIPSPLRADGYDFVQHDPIRTLNVLANDPFWNGYEGERRITRVIAGRLESEVAVAPDGRSITYKPLDTSESVRSIDTITYVVDDLYEQTVKINVYRPVVNDYFEVDRSSAGFAYDVTANDRYMPVGSSTYADVVDIVTSVTQPESGGVVRIAANGRSVLYTPPEGFEGTDAFTYVADGVHEATVRVNVTRPVRDDRIAELVYQDTPNQLLDVLQNDFLGNGYHGARVITAVGPTENGGVVAIRDDGKALLYTPAPGYTGADTFDYTVDGELVSDRVAQRVTALAQSESEVDPPLHVGRSRSRSTCSRTTVSALGYRGPGHVTTVELVSGSGEFSYSADGRVTFKPAERARDLPLRGRWRVRSDTLVSRAGPDQCRDQAVVDQNSGAIEIDVIANDFKRRTYSYHGPQRVSHATPSVNGGSVAVGEDGRTVSYTPAEDFYGRDTFTYTVDGFWTQTVSIEVIRRVRDDEFRVDSDDGTQTLPVLVNDLFGANYSGVGRITDVTATAAGAAVSIAADGQFARVHARAPGFAGIGHVHVHGGRRADRGGPRGRGHASGGPLPHVREQRRVLRVPARERVAAIQPTTSAQIAWTLSIANYLHLAPNFRRELPRDPTPASGVTRRPTCRSRGSTRGTSSSSTRTTRYVLTDAGVTIVDAWPAEELSVVSKVDITGRTIAQFLHGDRLTVISETGGWSHLYGFSDVVSFGRGGWPAWESRPYETIVTVIDVSDRTDPEIVQTTTMDGRYVDSRSVDGQVYTLVSNADVVLPRPQVIDEDDDPSTPGRYETVEEYTARATANRGQLIEDTLPSYTTTGPDGQTVRTGLLNTPDTIHRPLTADSEALISIVSIDSLGDAPGLTDTSAVYSTGAGVIYASHEGFYVFDADRSDEDGAVTRVVKFDWDPAAGDVDLAATTTVPGRIINQFSADESGGTLRIATTASNNRSGNWSGRDENLLFVLREDGGVMESVGSIQNWALDEDIRSVRFLGDRAFVTTFAPGRPAVRVWTCPTRGGPKRWGTSRCRGSPATCTWSTRTTCSRSARTRPTACVGRRRCRCSTSPS